MDKTTLDQAALDYHALPTPGKLAVVPTKGLTNQRDLALAYSPGVAAASRAIAGNPAEAARLTARSNLVGVVTNGTAVLGLGQIGPLAAKPVMEGKAVLFKKFANIDVFDLELNERDPDKLVEMIAALEPTFGGINLEDIKAPECFQIESRLRERMNIPVFHDDQHGTAIVVAAAVLNAMTLASKDLKRVKLVTSGAGAAALACLDLLVTLGLPEENIWVTDIEGVVYEGRTAEMDPYKARYAKRTEARGLAEVIQDADVFLGLSAGGVLKPEMVARMAPFPLIMALANPDPEILPEEVVKVRQDALIATGRSDYPNQVNNVLCFPFIFRGALDVGARTISDEMKVAAVHALAELARAQPSDVVAQAYGETNLRFGPTYLIPKPFDPRLIVKIAPMVARAAMDSGVATTPIEDLEAYRDHLSNFVYQSGFVMKPVFAAAKLAPRRVVFAEGEDERVLHAVQTVLEEGLAHPILIGRPEVVQMRIERIGLQLEPGKDFELVNPDSDPRYRPLWTDYHELLGRRGVTPDIAKKLMRSDTTLIGCMLLRHGYADALICGVTGRLSHHLQHVSDVIGRAPGRHHFAAMSVLLLPGRTLFISDTYVNENPDAATIAEITLMAADAVRRFGVTPRVALLSYSSFGSEHYPGARKLAEARAMIERLDPDLEVDGEMQADAALREEVRERLYQGCRLTGEANLLIMPNVDAANIAFNLLKAASGEGVSVGPILLGAARPVHILTETASVRRLVNMTALAVVEAQQEHPGALP
ncbi:Malate dehydrogenase (oxaloacetate-decarboxylating) (NADP(+)), Phosphate acetyltransferase [Thioalkalivibrio sulfidiphilus HL-EbGr7]|uniref:NADP-dependent malic enzyme n=1 Tax=Thioalkalivibrio sulfidiphilus (strain HL-EbGR7) TaxID=396588 RepID=B8GSA7_THISH|nr:NADP-dependent malic enzyme [Thioalkalivibrio sulfidiphilus]ACL72811.1 Malate dehydrogenase (oxaloacetate-decarboxylating) (NADP(+)), Phosphate acetyltransferase [Thioalkalivibrio sulfidiphilus HL-EbGr7]